MYKSSSEILKDYKKLKALIKDYALQLEEIDYDTTGPRAMTYDGDRISPTFKFNSETENTAIKREEKIKDIKVRKRICEIYIEKVDNARTVLTNRENKIIDMKYFEDKTFEEIAEIIDRSTDRCKQIMAESIKKMDDIIYSH